MVWPDISRWIWSYIISRLKLFTDLDPSKLELSATSLRVANVEVDQKLLNIPGIQITQFALGKLTIELTSSGIAIGASEVTIDAVLKSLEPPDLAISRILEHTRTDIEGYGAGDMSGMKSRFADFALSQIRSHITDVGITLRYPTSDLNIRVNVDQIVMNQKHHVELESIVITRAFSDNDSDSDDLSSSESESGSDSSSSSGEELSIGDPVVSRMARSVMFSQRCSSMRESALMKSVYFDASEGSRDSIAKEDAEIGTINRAVFTFSMDPMEVALDVDSVRVDGFVALQTLVETLNLLWKSSLQTSSSGEKLQPVKSELSVGSVEVHDSLADAVHPPFSLTSIRLQNGKLEVESLSIPEVINVNPLLSAYYENEKLKVEMTMPVSVTLSRESLPFIQQLVSRLGDVLSDLHPPPDPQPAPVDIHLPEFRLAIGQELTLLIFPESLTNTEFIIREILLTVAEGQLLVRNLVCQNPENLDSLKSIVEEVHLRWSPGFIRELSSILEIVFGEQVSSESRSAWDAIHLPNTYSKIKSLVVENDNAVVLRGDVELRTVDLNADVRASLDVDYNQLKTNFELSAYSNNGLRSIESSLNIFDFKICLEQPTRGDQSPESRVLPSPTTLLQTHPLLSFEVPEGVTDDKSTERPVLMPEVRVKLDFGNGIDVQFPDEHKSVFSVTVGVALLVIASDGAIAVEVPELFVKLRDPGGDVSLIKMQEFHLSHRQSSGSRGTETVLNIKRTALATCPDTYSLLSKLPVLVSPLPVQPHFDVDPDASVDIFKDVQQSRFQSGPEGLNQQFGNDLNVMVDAIDIREDYMNSPSRNPAAEDNKITLTKPTGLNGSRVKVVMRLFQWQMFDGFDLERSRRALIEAIERVETAASEVGEPDKDTEDDEDQRMFVGDFMYNSIFLVAQGGSDGKLSSRVANELGGTGSHGFDRSSEPKLTLVLRKSEFEHVESADGQSSMTLTIQDGKVNDTVSSSAFSHLIMPIGTSNQKVLVFTQETVTATPSPELRASLMLRPLRLQLDQDSVEFVNRFFQCDIGDSVFDSIVAERDSTPSLAFIQQFEFSELPLIIDYTPKKVDYKSLRSGVASELVNLFVVKGAKLTLKSSVLHGISGWDRLLQELAAIWAPDIRANQLTGLVSGIGPVRKAMRIGRGLKSWAIIPMRSNRTGQVTRGAGLVVRRAMDELMKLKTAWLESADSALGGADSSADLIVVPGSMTDSTTNPDTVSPAEEDLNHARNDELGTGDSQESPPGLIDTTTNGTGVDGFSEHETNASLDDEIASDDVVQQKSDLPANIGTTTT